MFLPRCRLAPETFLCRIILNWLVLCLVLIYLQPPSSSKSGKNNATRIEIQNIKTALGQFEVNVGRYPTTAEGLEALVKCPVNIPEKRWSDAYMEEVPHDCWGRPFRFFCPPQRPGMTTPFEIISAGCDGQFGTYDDLANYPLPRPYYQEYTAYLRGLAPSLLFALALAIVISTMLYQVVWWIVGSRGAPSSNDQLR